ncbi:branched-chain amino acid aminotransferase 2, chloroplastic [Vigna unguiculata]|uniref:Branched-chain-amino-acid aminotransferase n=1 Tax=Vigna unguiculata TaxID=3917 RepID=A0A4D6LS92_VIGUN|nr:branched-chain amino acid aminotransferase 2, chloroplastic [Vigna unguiculata]QCD91437.1 branched-chain amino acid aminotransferase [Vigna unguiculata]
MESSAVSARIRLTYPICPSRHFPSHQSPFLFPSSHSLSLKLSQNHFPLTSFNLLEAPSPLKPSATLSDSYRETCDLADIDWDNLGFGLQPTDYMYIMKCARGGTFSKGQLQRFGNIELNPSAGILNYGQGLFEGLKAYRKEDGNILLFRPEENGLRMQIGAERMCMPSPTVEQFVEAVKDTVLANKRWVPPPGKGSLYIRPLLMGSGPVLGLAPSPEYTFLIYVSPVGNYFKEGLAPINLIVENELHRATPGGTGGVKTIGNYAAVLKAQSEAKAKGYSDVLYLDCVHKRYLEEVSSCNIFVVKGNVISTPAIKGTILPGITRKSIIDVARSQGFQVEERFVSVDELLDADEVFCTGTAVVVSPVGSITYLGKRVSYGDGIGVVSQQLYTVLTRLQMGLSADEMNWTVELR